MQMPSSCLINALHERFFLLQVLFQLLWVNYHFTWFFMQNSKFHIIRNTCTCNCKIISFWRNEYRVVIWSSRAATIALLNAFISTQNKSMVAATALRLWKAARFFCIWIGARAGAGGCWPPIKHVLSAFKTFKTETIYGITIWFLLFTVFITANN